MAARAKPSSISDVEAGMQVNFESVLNGKKSRFEGVLLCLDADSAGPSTPTADAEENETPAKKARILHDDNKVRMWRSDEISELKLCQPNQVAHTEVEMKFKQKMHAFRGGSKRALQLKGEALESKPIDIWDEEKRSWVRGRVVTDSDGVTAELEGGEPLKLLDEHIWKLQEEDENDCLYASGEVTLMEDKSLGCIVTSSKDESLIHVYKQLRFQSYPTVSVTAMGVKIEEEGQNGENPIQCMIELPRVCRSEGPIDAVVDTDKWLKVTVPTINQSS